MSHHVSLGWFTLVVGNRVYSPKIQAARQAIYPKCDIVSKTCMICIQPFYGVERTSIDTERLCPCPCHRQQAINALIAVVQQEIIREQGCTRLKWLGEACIEGGVFIVQPSKQCSFCASN